MREQVAEAIYFIASSQRDQFIDEYTLDIRKSRIWDELTKSSKEYWQGRADQILSYQREEIEKGLLTDEEIYSLKAEDPILDMSFVDDYSAEVKILLQAQLQKSLALLK